MPPRGITDPELRVLLTEIEKNPRDVALHRRLALYHWQHGQMTESWIEFRKILRIQPENREAPFAMAAIAHQRGHLHKTYEFLFDVVCPDSTRGGDRKNHGLPSFNWNALVYSASTFPAPYNAIDWKELFEGIEAHIRSDEVYIEQRLQSGVVCIEQRCYDKAIRIFTYLATLDRRNPLIRLHRAAALSARRRDTEAEQEYNEAIMLQPTNPAAYKGLGVVRARRGDEQKARQAFEQVLKLDPHDPEARRWMEKIG